MSDMQLKSLTPLAESAEKAEVKESLDSVERLSALVQLDILDTPTERTFQILTDLANKILGTPVALISLVTPERQFFVSSTGLSEPYCSDRETDLSHSFCQYVVTRKAPLVISDALNHSLVRNNLAIPNLGVAAYLGVPMVLKDGNVLGSFCAIDGEAREWTEGDLNSLTKLAAVACSELETRKAALLEKQQLEERLRQSQKMETIGNFTSGVAHDFNHFLAAIQVHTDLLNRKLDSDSAACEHINVINTTVAAATGVVNQLLSFSKPEDSEMAAISLSQFVEEGLPLFKMLMPTPFKIEFAGQSEHTDIVANRDQMNQVLLNLVGNAKDAMKDQGGGTVKIEVAQTHLDQAQASALEMSVGPVITLKVTDKGCGMPNEILHRIHDPYFSTKPIGQGTGLGLWNVFKIAKLHSAKTSVESEVGEGTVITIFFPPLKSGVNKDCSSELSVHVKPSVLERVDVVSNSAEANSAEADVTSQAALRVMVVDDEAVLADGVKEHLDFEGHSTTRFLDGAEALEAFMSDPSAFDLIITDQVMPKILGSDLVAKIKTINPQVKAIICSGVLDSQTSAHLSTSHLSTSPDGVLKKPFRIHQLMEVIAKVTG